MFKKLTANPRRLLREIVDSDNPVDMLKQKLAECKNFKQNDELLNLMRELYQERIHKDLLD